VNIYIFFFNQTLISLSPRYAAYFLSECTSQVVLWKQNEESKKEEGNTHQNSVNEPSEMNDLPSITRTNSWIIDIFYSHKFQYELALSKLLSTAIRVTYVVGVHEEAVIRYEKREALLKGLEIEKDLQQTTQFDDGLIPSLKSSLYSPSLVLIQKFFHILLSLLPCQQHNIRNFLYFSQIAHEFSTFGSIASMLLLSVDFPRRVMGI
jgi:hypothetical protein